MLETTLPLATRREAFRRIAGHIRAMAHSRSIRILEAGCGRHWPIDLSGVSYTLVGVDLDAEALASRKAKYGDLDEIVVADLTTVQFPPATFDVVYSAFVLEHIPGVERLLDKFVEWVRPGGLLALLFPDRDSVYAFFARITPWRVHVLYKKHLFGMKDAGRPGFGPYPTYHDEVIARDRFHEYFAAKGLRLREELGFDTLPYMQQKFCDAVSLISMRRLVSTHINLCYVLERPPVSMPASASSPAEMPAAASRSTATPALAAERVTR